MGQIILWWVGLAAQLVGVFIALVGVFATQREYKQQDEPWMLDWVFTAGRWIDHSYRWARDYVRYDVLRKKRSDAQVRVSEAAGGLAGVFAPTVRITHEPLSDELSIEEKLRILDTRVRQDNSTLSRLEQELIAERRRIDNAYADLENRTAELRQHTSATLAAYATRGIKASAVGLFLTALGMVCSALAQPPMLH